MPARDPLVGEAEIGLHAEALGDRFEGGLDLVPSEVEPVELELHALEEDVLVGVGVLLGVDDVAVVPVEEAGHFSDDALLVRAGEQEDGGRLGHGKRASLRGASARPRLGSAQVQLARLALATAGQECEPRQLEAVLGDIGGHLLTGPRL